MKVIFLDVDGVLNCHTTKQKIDGILGIDPVRVARLKEIVDATGAQLVLSSTWRMRPRDVVSVANALAEFDMELIGKTPILSTIRGDEIAAWLAACEEEITHICILDDDTDMGNLTKHLVKTNFFKGGLCPKQVQKAIKMLNAPVA